MVVLRGLLFGDMSACGVHREASLAGEGRTAVNGSHRTGQDEQAALDTQVEVTPVRLEERREPAGFHQDDIPDGRGENGGGDLAFAGRNERRDDDHALRRFRQNLLGQSLDLVCGSVAGNTDGQLLGTVQEETVAVSVPARTGRTGPAAPCASPVPCAASTPSPGPALMFYPPQSRFRAR